MGTQPKEFWDRKLGHHLSQIQELSREHSVVKEDRSCIFPPILPPQAQRETQDPAMLALYEQQRKLEDSRCLLEELAHIEWGLRDSLRRDVERQQEMETIRREENRMSWTSLCCLRLNQRTTKAFVSSYYKNIPMHIYCLPIQSVARKPMKKNRKKKKK